MKKTHNEKTESEWHLLESELNRILEHLKEGRECENLLERTGEIERHARRAKASYDWIDNFCALNRT